jgi:hypothetical protein
MWTPGMAEQWEPRETAQSRKGEGYHSILSRNSSIVLAISHMLVYRLPGGSKSKDLRWFLKQLKLGRIHA